MADNGSDWLNDLLERFPALDALGIHERGRPIPYVQAMGLAECGAACLAMVLSYHGKNLGLQEIRNVLDVKQGTNAQQLLEAAGFFGLRGHGVSLDTDQLEYLEAGSILHWEFNHFVVFEKQTRKGITIVDPARGRRLIPLDHFKRSFTGVALLLEPAHDFQPSAGKTQHFARYLKEILSEPRLWSSILITSLLLQLFGLALPMLTSVVVETIIPRADERLLVIVSCGLLVVIFFNLLGTLIRSHLLLWMRTRLDARITPGLMDHLVSLPLQFFQQRWAGELAFQLSSAGAIRDAFTSAILSGGLDGTLVVAYLVLIFLFSPLIGVVVLLLGLAQVILFLATRTKRVQLVAEEVDTDTKARAQAAEVLYGIETVKAMGLEHRLVQQWTNAYVDAANASVARGNLVAFVDSMNAALRMGSPLVVLGLGAYQVIHGHLSLGAMLAVNAVAVGFLTPVANLVSTAVQLHSLKIHIQRLDDIFSMQPEPRRPRVLENLVGNVRIENVSFRYGPLSPLALDKVTLDIKAGEFVAVVGKSGSGKSTLVKVIAGLYVPSQGAIFFDGVNLEELDLPSLRQQLGSVPQRPYFMTGSIRSNLSNHDLSVPMESIEEATRLAWVHEEILAMPMGYETIMVGDGGTVSGGQRQRIALARALIRKPKLLLLDEATSALDAVTEMAVQANLESLKGTRVVVAHRLSTVVRADRIVVIDQGKVVDVGAHADLLSRCALYQDLVRSQMRTS